MSARDSVRFLLAITRGLIRDRGSVPAKGRWQWLVIATCTWLLAGAYLDSWAHRHLPRLETFFTPWHALLYAGLFATLALLGTTALRNQRKGHGPDDLLPMGYGLSLLGGVMFGIAGFIDMLWHLRFGIEVSLAALVSPPHLLLMFSAALIVTGPLRRAWQLAGRRAPWTAIVSAALLLSMFTFFDQFDQPLVSTWAARAAVPKLATEYAQQLGILGIMVQTALLTGVVLYLVGRFTLPFGAIAVLVGLNGALLGSLQQNFDLIPVAIVGGLLADILLAWLRPGPDRVRALRVASSLGPAAVASLYLIVLQLERGIDWPINLWLGSIFVCAAIGLLLSYLVVPPRTPRLETEAAVEVRSPQTVDRLAF